MKKLWRPQTQEHLPTDHAPTYEQIGGREQEFRSGRGELELVSDQFQFARSVPTAGTASVLDAIEIQTPTVGGGFRLSGRMQDDGYLSFSTEGAEFPEKQAHQLQAAEAICSKNKQKHPTGSDN